MKKLLIIVLIVELYAKDPIAIVDFEGINIRKGEAKALTQRLTTEMISLDVYQLVERSKMNKLLDEQKTQYSGCIDLKCAVEIGKILGAKFIVVGTVSRIGQTYSIDSRLINVETGASLISASFSDNNEIDNLLNQGMKSIAIQLCNLENSLNLVKNNENQGWYKSIINLKKGQSLGLQINEIGAKNNPELIPIITYRFNNLTAWYDFIELGLGYLSIDDNDKFVFNIDILTTSFKNNNIRLNIGPGIGLAYNNNIITSRIGFGLGFEFREKNSFYFARIYYPSFYSDTKNVGLGLSVGAMLEF